MKKKYSTIKLLVSLIFLYCLPIQAQNYEITHYNLQFEIIPNDHRLIAESELYIKFLSGDFTEKLELYINCDSIISVKDFYDIELPFSKEERKIIIFLRNTPDDSLVIKLNYEGIYLGRVSNRIDLKSSWMLFESNFYPRVNDDEIFNNRFSFNIEVTVPDSMTVVSAGELIKTDTSKDKKSFFFSSINPEPIINICTAVYKINEYENEGIKIKTFLFPEHQLQSDTLVKIFSKILNFYQARFGKYPFNDFKIIETERRGGYAPLGQFLLNSQMIDNIDDLGIFIIAHEVAHQWFPHIKMFYPDYYLNESFAQYAAFAYSDFIGITEKEDNSLKKKIIFMDFGIDGNLNELARVKDHFVYEEKPLSEISLDDARLYKWAAYYKGFYFLRSLALEAGRDTFDLAISSIIENTTSTHISLNEFVNSVEKTSGKSLQYQVSNWINTNKILDYELSNYSTEILSNGNYKTTLNIVNNGAFIVPFEVAVTTKSGEMLIGKVELFSNNEASYEFISKEEIIKAEVDPYWYLLDADRTNNFYPRKNKISFLFSNYSVTEDQYFYYPSITYGQRDKIRLGLWTTNIYPVFTESIKRNIVPIEWRFGLFYGFATKRIGYQVNLKTILSIPLYRWEAGLNLSNFRGTENYNAFINYNFVKDEKNSKHNILNATLNRDLIYDLAYYDFKDYETGTNTTFSLDWDRIIAFVWDGVIVKEKEHLNLKVGQKVFGGEFSYSKINMELENLLPVLSRWFNFRIYGGIVRGSYPIQESVYLSGSVEPSSFAYWFVDPDNKISTQENLHVRGDANLRGYIGQHLKGKNGFGINIEIPVPQLNIINLFVDVGNVWDKKFDRLKYDLGLGIDLQFVRVDFPLYINEPINDERRFAFRWLLELSF
jgi:hypothetical protein